MATKSSSLLLRGAIVVAVLAAAAVATYQLSRPVATVARVRAGTATNAISGSVTVDAEYTMDLKSEVGGRVIESTMDLDKHVKAGDVLVRLDKGDLELDLERTLDEYKAAKEKVRIGSPVDFELEAAKEVYANAERQFKAGLLSEADLATQKRQVRAIEQRKQTETVNSTLTLQDYETAIKLKQRQLQKMTITAPFDGVIAQVFTRAGDLLANGAPICRLISTSRTVEARISEENIAGVRVGQKAYVQFLPYDIQQFDAKVVKVMSTADPETQRYFVDLDVQIDPAKLLPGITGEVSIILDERPSKTIVPRRAVFGNQVFVVKDGRVELRKVKVGYTSMTAVEILEGVSEGEWVIVDQLDKFRDGGRVRTVPVDDPRWK